MEAIRVWNLLASGTGALHWEGLELLVELYGITDVEGLLYRLETIKLHGKDTHGHRNGDD